MYDFASSRAGAVRKYQPSDSIDLRRVNLDEFRINSVPWFFLKEVA
jgi:hypothetical protein